MNGDTQDMAAGFCDIRVTAIAVYMVWIAWKKCVLD